MSIKIGSDTVIADDLGLTAGDSTLNSLTVTNETTTTSLQVTGNNIPRLTLSNPQYDAATYRLETSIQALNISNVLNGVSRPRITIEDNGHVSIPDGNLTVAEGNLLVGTTSTTPAVSNDSDGIALQSNGTVQFSASATTTAIINRKSTDGAILQFRKDGSTVGSIGTTTNSYLWAGGTNSGIFFYNNGFGPSVGSSGNGALTDNTKDIGASGNRFKDLYLSGGVYLGGTGSANKLDDYEFGAWFPVISDATSGGNTGTSTVAYATYTKVGNLVHLKARLVNMDTTGMGSGNIYVQGVPFAADGDGEGVASMSFFTAAANSLGIVPSIDDGASYIKLKEVISGGVYINADSSQFTSGTADLWITITYNT